MQVAYFSNQFADAQGHGLSRYARELWQALGDAPGAHTIIPVAAWSSLDAAQREQLQRDSGLRLLPLGRRLTPLCWTFAGAPRLERLVPTEIDLVHAASMGYPIATDKPLVVTVHDLGPLSHPEFFRNTRPWVYRRSLAQVVRQAKKIICVSRSSADELLSFGGRTLHSRIEVIPEGVSPRFFEDSNSDATKDLSCLNAMPQGTPYLLSTGKISPRKNIRGVVLAFAELARHAPHHLVLVGGDGWEVTPVRKLVHEHGLGQRVHFTGYVPDQTLRDLYAGASAYVHPSLYEGFGLTVLEAMAAGCPVITSNCTSLPEVAGDAALLVDPLDPQALAAALKDVCEDASLAAELRLRGRARAGSFSWRACAAQTLSVYRAILD